MPRPKSIPVYEEGPQAAENFTRLMKQLVQAPRAVLESKRRETVSVTITDTTTTKKRKRRRK
jgi:hypothetical protein